MIPSFLADRMITMEWLGSYFPEKLKIDSRSKNPKDFSWISNTKYGTFIFIVTPTCESCDFDIIKKFMENFKEFEYIVFFHSSEEYSVEQFFDNSENNYKALNCEINIINESITYGAIAPFMFSINKVGQIINGYIYNTYEDIIGLARPILNKR